MIFNSNWSNWLKKTVIFLLIITFICSYFYIISCDIKSSREKSYVVKDDKKTGATIKKITGEIQHGLYEIKIDDSTTILLYRGVESCTMIKK